MDNLPPSESGGGLFFLPFWLVAIIPAFGFCKLFGLPWHSNDAHLMLDAFCWTLLVNAIIGSILGFCWGLLLKRFRKSVAQKP
jgi:hypothetical protein